MISPRPATKLSRLRHTEPSLYPRTTFSGSHVFHASSAACTFSVALRSSNGGNGGCCVAMSRLLSSLYRCRLSLPPVTDVYLMNVAVALSVRRLFCFAPVRPDRPGRGRSQRSRNVKRILGRPVRRRRSGKRAEITLACWQVNDLLGRNVSLLECGRLACPWTRSSATPAWA